MVDLKKFILTSEELDALCKPDEYLDETLEWMAFFVEHNRNEFPNHVDNYRQMIEFEDGISEFVFSFNFDAYYLDDFELGDLEFLKIILGCFVEFDLKYACFYEEDNNYCLAEYGLEVPQYIEHQMTEFLSDFNVAIDELGIDTQGIYEGVSYSIHVLTIKKEYIPFEEVYKYFNLIKTTIPNTYICICENYNDGYYYSDNLFKLGDLKEVIERIKLPVIESNKKIAKDILKLKLAINHSNVVHSIFSLFGTEEEVMF